MIQDHPPGAHDDIWAQTRRLRDLDEGRSYPPPQHGCRSRMGFLAGLALGLCAGLLAAAALWLVSL